MTDKKAELSSQVPDTQPVVDLLTRILNEVQQQVQSKTPKPLEGEALRAVELFREIGAALALQPQPTIKLTASGLAGDTVTLNWESTDAQTVSIDQKVGAVTTPLGEVTSAAGGSKEFTGSTTTTFTATAKGPCASATASVTVTFSP